MKLLLTAVLCLIVSPHFAQVGNDPTMINPNGLPVMVPSKAPARYNEYRHNRQQRVRIDIPGTMRSMENYRTPTEQGQTGIVYNESFYNDEQNEPDTTRILLFDAEGKPYRDISRIYQPLTPDDEPETVREKEALRPAPWDTEWEDRTREDDATRQSIEGEDPDDDAN